MAYYDRACVNTIGVIRKLQRERYYPLSVIKRLMESAPVEQVELELLDAIHKADAPDPGERVTLSEAARRSGLTTKQIARLAECGALAPVREGRQKFYSTDDLGVLALANAAWTPAFPLNKPCDRFRFMKMRCARPCAPKWTILPPAR